MECEDFASSLAEKKAACRGKDTVGTGWRRTIGHLCLGNFRRRLARVYVMDLRISRYAQMTLFKTSSGSPSETDYTRVPSSDLVSFAVDMHMQVFHQASTSCQPGLKCVCKRPSVLCYHPRSMSGTWLLRTLIIHNLYIYPISSAFMLSSSQA